MHGSTFSTRPTDRRPVAPWLQGLVTGITAALVPTAVWAVSTDTHAYPVSFGTSVVVALAVIAFAVTVWCYIPVDEEVAAARAPRRPVDAPAPRTTQATSRVRLHAVPDLPAEQPALAATRR